MSNGESTSITIDIDSAVYRLSAIKKAAYRLSGRGNFRISTIDGGRISVAVEAFKTASIQALVDDFNRELLDQELREEIAEQTTPVRNLLLAQAFSATSLIDPSVDSPDYHNDPLNISKPDKDKSASEA